MLRTKEYADRIIVVDDGSTDGTAKVAALAGAEVVRHDSNKGKGAALKTGFEKVGDAKVIVILDTDGQHNPSDIPKLIEPILKGEADFVNGSRYLKGNGQDTPIYRRMGQKILDTATNWDSGLIVSDSQSGFRAFAGHIMPIFRFGQNGMAIESEMLADAGKAGLRMKEVEIGTRYDVGKSTEHPVSHGLMVLVHVLHDIELRRPLYYFTIPGFIIAAIGIGMGLQFLRIFYLGGSLHFGPTLLMVMMTLIGSFMAFTGIVLHAMSTLMSNTKEDINESFKKVLDEELKGKR